MSHSTEDDKKILCQMLGKLYIPDEVDEDKVRTLKLLLTTLQEVRLYSCVEALY